MHSFSKINNAAMVIAAKSVTASDSVTTSF